MKCNISKIVAKHLKENLPDTCSAYIISSIARGDFITGKSDIDLLLVFDDDVKLEEMKILTDKVTDDLRKKLNLTDTGGHSWEIDILYIHQKDIPTTPEQSAKSPFPLFSIFGFDLQAHHIHICGNEILRKFTPANPQKLVSQFIRQWIHKSVTDSKNTTLYAGQILRALAISVGAKSLAKNEITKTIAKSNLPQFVKDYSKLHYNYCYQTNTSKPLPSIDKQSTWFIAQIEKNLAHLLKPKDNKIKV